MNDKIDEIWELWSIKMSTKVGKFWSVSNSQEDFGDLNDAEKIMNISDKTSTIWSKERMRWKAF